MDKMELWNEVCKTNPQYAKNAKVGGGHKITAICAQSQIMAATAQWGPMGDKWGVDWDLIGGHESLCLVRVTLYYPSYTENQPGQVSHAGSSPWQGPYDIDSEALKKAITDGTTKCLSMLGFNADIFLGEYDGCKYDEKQNSKGITPDQVLRISEEIVRTGTDSDVLDKHILDTYKRKSIGEMNMAEGKIILGQLERKPDTEEV